MPELPARESEADLSAFTASSKERVLDWGRGGVGVPPRTKEREEEGCRQQRGRREPVRWEEAGKCAWRSPPVRRHGAGIRNGEQQVISHGPVSSRMQSMEQREGVSRERGAQVWRFPRK